MHAKFQVCSSDQFLNQLGTYKKSLSLIYKMFIRWRHHRPKNQIIWFNYQISLQIDKIDKTMHHRPSLCTYSPNRFILTYRFCLTNYISLICKKITFRVNFHRFFLTIFCCKEMVRINRFRLYFENIDNYANVIWNLLRVRRIIMTIFVREPNLIRVVELKQVSPLTGL